MPAIKLTAAKAPFDAASSTEFSCLFQNNWIRLTQVIG